MLETIKNLWEFTGTEQSKLKKSFFVTFLGSAFNTFQFLAVIWTIMLLLDREKNPRIAILLLEIMLICVAGKGICSYYSNQAQVEAGYHMVSHKRISIGQKLKRIPMGYFNEAHSREIVGVLTTILNDLENMVPRILMDLFGGLLNIFFLAIFLFFIEYHVAIIFLVGIMLFLLIISLSQKKAKKNAQLRQNVQAELNAAAIEYIDGIGVIKSFNLEKSANQSLNQAINNSYKENLKTTNSLIPYTALGQLIVRSTSTITLLWVLYLLVNGMLDTLTALFLVIIDFFFFSQIETAGSMMSMLQLLDVSIKKADDIENLPVLKDGSVNTTPESYTIELHHVTFGYDNKVILKDINMFIDEKKTTAIVGMSGSGKTTLCRLIARFWDIDSGEIKLNGININNYTMETLLKSISFVFQNVHLFNDTVRNNIAFGKSDATMEEIRAAAQKAQIDDFILGLPNGYDTVIGEGGSLLSGGEQQRISIARAILKDSPIIILDEATSSIDPENEYLIQTALQELTKNKTVIVIAHRLNTIRQADCIYVLDSGRITQKGKHEDLVKEKGLYAKFIQIRKKSLAWKV